MQKLTTCLWFNDQAEEAANLYTSIFKDSSIGNILRYEEEGAAISGRQPGSAMTVAFTIEGREFLALNGGPMFKFNEAISLVINCGTQEEIDYYWERLTDDGGEESMCGWLKDKFGVSWQVNPRILSELMSGSDPEGAKRATQAMFQMKKFDIAALEKAYIG